MKKIFLYLLLIALALFVQPASGALITQQFLGEITFAAPAPSNPLGVTAGQTFTWETTYDDSIVNPSGISWVQPVSLNIPVGTWTYTKAQDNDLLSGFPKLLFMDGVLAGVDALSNPIPSMSYNDRLWAFTTDTPLPPSAFNFQTFSVFSYYLTENLITGVRNVVTDRQEPIQGRLSFSPVPIPAPILLLGTGLLGLAGFRRKKSEL